MGPKKRDKVPLKKAHSSFKYIVPFGSVEKHESMKKYDLACIFMSLLTIITPPGVV